VRYGGGLGAALPHLLVGRLDVAFGRTEGLPRAFPSELTRRMVRYEPVGLLVLDDHPLAHLDAVPLESLRGLEIDTSTGNEEAPEWVDLGTALLEEFGARASAPHPHVVGPNETARHLRSHGLPILTMTECPAVDGAVVRPLTGPVPLYPWAMVHRADLKHPALETLTTVVAQLGAREGWLEIPDDFWLPAPEDNVIRSGRYGDHFV
jgi:hypothetical protein